MAFNRTRLARASSSGNTTAPAIWTYKTTEDLTAIKGANYFNNASKELRVNDVIIAMTETGGTASLDLIHVSAIAAGVVTIGTADINDA